MALPPATIAEGPLGILGRHSWNFDFTMTREPGLPRYYLDRIGGLRDRPEWEDNRAPNVGRPGETIYPSEARGKTIVYEGRVQAADLPGLEIARTALLVATASPDEGMMAIEPQIARGGTAWFAFARVQTCICDFALSRNANARPTPWQSEFVLTLRMHNPVFYESDPNEEVHASGVTAENLGNAPTFPGIFIEVPVGEPTIVVANSTIGKQLTFVGLPEGTLAISFQYRTVSIDDTSAVAYLDDLNSDWWDEGVPGMVPGDNAISQTGGTLLTVQWSHASY